jgi:uncharacterized UPF0146 family protein
VSALARGRTDRDAGPPADASEREAADAVDAGNPPVELQRPTVALADRLDAVCVFTTLGFEEPVVPVRRRSVEGTVLYVASGGEPGSPPSAPD